MNAELLRSNIISAFEDASNQIEALSQDEDFQRFKNITFTVIENNNNYIHSVIVQDKYGTMANFKPDELELINE